MIKDIIFRLNKISGNLQDYDTNLLTYLGLPCQEYLNNVLNYICFYSLNFDNFHLIGHPILVCVILVSI